MNSNRIKIIFLALLLIIYYFIQSNLAPEVKINSLVELDIGEPDNKKNLPETITLSSSIQSKSNTSEIAPENDKSAVNIVSCNSDNAKNFKDILEEHKVLGDDSFENSDVSISLNERLVYSMLHDFSSKDSNSTKLGYLKSIVESYPEDKFARWNLLEACINNRTDESCSESIEIEAIEQDGNNGAVWFDIAALRAKRNDIDGALEALNEAASSSYYSEYFSERFERVDETLSLSGINNPSDRMIVNFGLYAKTEIGGIGSTINFCKEHSLTRGDVADACINMGEIMFNSAFSHTHKSFGLALQSTVYHNLADENSINEIENKRKNINKAMSDEQLIKAFSLLRFDEDLATYWFESLKSYGEINARQLLVEEAVRLSSDRNYNPCQNQILNH